MKVGEEARCRMVEEHNDQKNQEPNETLWRSGGHKHEIMSLKSSLASQTLSEACKTSLTVPYSSKITARLYLAAGYTALFPRLR